MSHVAKKGRYPELWISRNFLDSCPIFALSKSSFFFFFFFIKYSSKQKNTLKVCWLNGRVAEIGDKADTLIGARHRAFCVTKISTVHRDTVYRSYQIDRTYSNLTLR